jgi:hypothetical protein
MTTLAYIYLAGAILTLIPSTLTAVGLSYHEDLKSTLVLLSTSVALSVAWPLTWLAIGLEVLRGDDSPDPE